MNNLGNSGNLNLPAKVTDYNKNGSIDKDEIKQFYKENNIDIKSKIISGPKDDYFCLKTKTSLDIVHKSRSDIVRFDTPSILKTNLNNIQNISARCGPSSLGNIIDFKNKSYRGTENGKTLQIDKKKQTIKLFKDNILQNTISLKDLGLNLSTNYEAELYLQDNINSPKPKSYNPYHNGITLYNVFDCLHVLDKKTQKSYNIYLDPATQQIEIIQDTEDKRKRETDNRETSYPRIFQRMDEQRFLVYNYYDSKTGKLIPPEQVKDQEVFTVDSKTGKKLYSSNQLSKTKVQQLNNHNIKYHQILNSEQFVDHVIQNRDLLESGNIEELTSKPVVLIFQEPDRKKDAFTVNNLDQFTKI